VKIELPQFEPNAGQRDWVQSENATARFIRAFWSAAGQRRSDPKFVVLLVTFGWLNKSEDWKSTRLWRNQNIADYLKVSYESDEQLGRELIRIFPHLKQATQLLKMDSGITHYYKPFRTATREFVLRHAALLSRIFKQVSEPSSNPDAKIWRAVDTLTGLGKIAISGHTISPLNGLSPTLACLDPSRRLPIMNSKTYRLLSVIGKEQDSDGALALSGLIGHNKIKDSFDLDVYAATAKFTAMRRRRPPASTTHSTAANFRDVGLRSEIESFAKIAASRRRMRKLHNALTNRFFKYLTWRYRLPNSKPKESQFDAVIPDWRLGRSLLVEAKTAWDGPGGRTQIRQAIGQLFDYRHKFFNGGQAQVDLAVLLPNEPSADVRALLAAIGIEVIWFNGNKLCGSIEL
jgi:hypothetical protein